MRTNQIPLTNLGKQRGQAVSAKHGPEHFPEIGKKGATR